MDKAEGEDSAFQEVHVTQGDQVTGPLQRDKAREWTAGLPPETSLTDAGIWAFSKAVGSHSKGPEQKSVKVRHASAKVPLAAVRGPPMAPVHPSKGSAWPASGPRQQVQLRPQNRCTYNKPKESVSK